MATTIENLFNSISKSKQSIGVTFSRTNPVPLEKYSVFQSYSEASSYAADSLAAYPGQIVNVLSDGYPVSSYVINPNGTLDKIIDTHDICAYYDICQEWVKEQKYISSVPSSYAQLSDISKVFIKDQSEAGYEDGKQSDLSVIKLTNEEYAVILSNDEAQPNALYVISDDCIDAYGMQIKNLAEPTISSDATTRNYVDNADSSISRKLSSLLSSMYDDVEHIATDDIISSLHQKSCISNVICAVVEIKDTFISLRETLSGMLGL